MRLYLLEGFCLGLESSCLVPSREQAKKLSKYSLEKPAPLSISNFRVQTHKTAMTSNYKLSSLGNHTENRSSIPKGSIKSNLGKLVTMISNFKFAIALIFPKVNS